MIDSTSVDLIRGANVIDTDGDKIGTVEQVYIDPATGNPIWASVRTGLFGTKESFVPLDDASFANSDVTVGYDKAFVKDAPRVDADGSLSEDDIDTLHTYYGRNYTSTDTGTTTDAGYVPGDYDDTTDNEHGTVGRDTSGPTTDSAMTRSEEQLHVGTEKVEAGRARLHKYVVTEQQTVTVPVSHEEVRLVSEPITAENAGDAFDGPSISEEEHEVVLTEERVVVNKEAVPVERVRLDPETVTEQQSVTEDVRKERIELEDPTSTTDTTTKH